jgi:hypothetical protein
MVEASTKPAKKAGAKKAKKADEFCDKFEPSHIAHIGGPILLTSPHSCNLRRGGEASGIPEERHLREQCVGVIVLQVAEELERLGTGSSFIIWHKDKKLDYSHDPNFMTAVQCPESQFHKFIHHFIKHNSSKDPDHQVPLPGGEVEFLRANATPLMHIDFHGKKDKEDNLNIDLGIKALKKTFSKEEKAYVTGFSDKFVSEVGKNFEKYKFREHSVTLNPNGDFHGMWMVKTSSPVFTMVQ